MPVRVQAAKLQCSGGRAAVLPASSFQGGFAHLIYGGDRGQRDRFGHSEHQVCGWPPLQSAMSRHSSPSATPTNCSTRRLAGKSEPRCTVEVDRRIE